MSEIEISLEEFAMFLTQLIGNTLTFWIVHVVEGGLTRLEAMLAPGN